MTEATIICDSCGRELVEWYTARVDEETVRENMKVYGWLCTESGDYCSTCKEAHQ